MAASDFDLVSLIRDDTLMSRGETDPQVDAWLVQAQYDDKKAAAVKGVRRAVLKAAIWDRVPEFAFQDRSRFKVKTENNIATRAAILMQMIPNLEHVQILGRIQNPVTFAAILHACPNLHSVALTLYDETLGPVRTQNFDSGTYDEVLSKGTKALQMITLQKARDAIDARKKRGYLSDVAIMYGRYAVGEARISRREIFGQVAFGGLAGGVTAFASGAALPAYLNSGDSTEWQHKYGFKPRGPAATAFGLGVVFGVLSTLQMISRPAPRKEKFFRMKINGRTAAEWFEQCGLTDVETEYDRVVNADKERPEPRTRPSVPATPPNRRGASARSPSRRR